MSDALKREISLTVLRIGLTEWSDGKSSDSRQSSRRISCELQVTGNAAERGLASASQSASEPQTSNRRSSNRRPQAYDNPEITAFAGSQPRVLAHWMVSPAELQLPVEYGAAIRFNDKPNVVSSLLARFGRWAASNVLSQMSSDGLERLVAGVQWLPSGSPTLPSTMIRQLQLLLPTVLRENDCLWIEFAEPMGYVPLLPWEEMLRTATTAPILRLSPHDVRSVSTQRGLSVALCVTAPSSAWIPAPETFVSLTRSILRALPEGSVLHVFADDLCHPAFKKAWGSQRVQGGSKLEVYDPPKECAKAEVAEYAGSWRTWVGESLRGSAVDIFHCIAPGFFFADTARLVVAQYPHCAGKALKAGKTTLGRPLLYLTASELSEWLTAFGAWGAIFSMPLRGSWLVQARMGLRLLTDHISRSRPVAIALHDPALDTDSKAIAETYDFLIGDPSIKASTSPAIALYCHPSRALHAASEPTALPTELLSEYLKIKQVIQTVSASGKPMPGWMAATQRVVEQAMSRASIAGTQEVNPAAVRGVTAALKYIDKMLAEGSQARAADQSNTTERGTTSG